jgi:hypothetical protein
VTAGILFQFPSTQGVNFRKKKPKHFKILEGRPKELLYIYPKNYFETEMITLESMLY